MSPRYWFLAASLIVFSGTGCVNRQAQEQGRRTAAVLNDPVKPVQIAPVELVTLTETLAVTGDVTAGQDTVVGAKQPGRIVEVLVKDGDTVAAGQLVARLDPTQAQAQVSQAEAQVGTALAATNQALAQQRQAQSALTQAIRNAKSKPDQTAAAVRQAQAQLASARAQLQKSETGARPEERRQAEANVASARTNLETQTKELARIERLVNEGALAGNRLDQQRNATQSARTQLENAQQALNIIVRGNRTEDVQIARAAVRQAEEGVASARATKELDSLLQDQVETARAQVAASRAQYESAQAQLRSAQAQVSIAREALRDTEIRAPFAGKVVGRPAQSGTIAGSQTEIVRIIGESNVYFSGEVPSTEVARVRAGMPVSVTIDALQNRSFAGSVVAVAPIGRSVGRLFDVRIALPADPEIRAGMFARGTVTTRTIPQATVVPLTAVVSRDDQKVVFIKDGDVAKAIKVTTGIQQGQRVQVFGLPQAAQIIVSGQVDLTDGAKIREDKAETKEPAKGESSS